MNPRFLLLAMATGAIVAAGLYHARTLRTQSRMDSARAQMASDAAAVRRLRDETYRQIADARSERASSLGHGAAPPASEISPSTAAPANRGTAPAPSKSGAAPSDSELRRWQVQAFVSDQRLRFAALLKRLGLTPDKLQQFDDIQGAYLQVVLDSSQAESARKQAAQTRDAQLKDLFGSAYEQWEEANRNQPDRAIVTQLVQQTFQSSGTLTSAQADELTRIVGRHRISPPKDTKGGPTRYDWDQIIDDARSVLADRQMDDFITAIEFRRTSDKMSAMTAKKNP